MIALINVLANGFFTDNFIFTIFVTKIFPKNVLRLHLEVTETSPDKMLKVRVSTNVGTFKWLI